MDIKLIINDDVLNSFYSIVKSRSTYLGFMAIDEKLCIYSEMNEVYFMSFCRVKGTHNFSLRLPVETMMVIMHHGYITIKDVTSGSGSTSIELCSYDINNNLLFSATIASEYSDLEEQIREFINAMVNDNDKIIVKTPSIFSKASALTKPNYKDIGIKGITFNNGKCYTIANGYAAFMDDPFNLSLVLSNTTLRELISFCQDKKEVSILRHGGYNICMSGVNMIAWRRVRTTDFIQVPAMNYDIHVKIQENIIIKTLKFITSDVSSCYLDIIESSIKILSQVGYYKIPVSIDTTNTTVKTINLNYKLISKLLANVHETVSIDICKTNMHILINNVNYYIAIRYS